MAVEPFPETFIRDKKIEVKGEVQHGTQSEDFLFVVKTRAGGDCAFHAVLGEWDKASGEFVCAEVVSKRAKLREVISQNPPDVMPLILEGVRELVISGHSFVRSKSALQALSERYQKLSTEDEVRSAELWKTFSKILEEHTVITNYISNHHQLAKKAPLRQQFYDALNRNGGELYALILSLPPLHTAFQYYNQEMNYSFDWQAALAPAVLKEYADFISQPRIWLLSSELAMVAQVFARTVVYYPAPGAKAQLFNPNQTCTVTVQFNGRDHYERMVSAVTKSQLLATRRTPPAAPLFSPIKQSVESNVTSPKPTELPEESKPAPSIVPTLLQPSYTQRAQLRSLTFADHVLPICDVHFTIEERNEAQERVLLRKKDMKKTEEKETKVEAEKNTATAAPRPILVADIFAPPPELEKTPAADEKSTAKPVAELPKPVHRVLVLGQAGSGKTTLSKYIACQWVQGKLWRDCYDQVFWLTLRDLHTLSFAEVSACVKSPFLLATLIHRLCLDKSARGTIGIKAIHDVLTNKPYRILLLLDGYDEVAQIMTDASEAGNLRAQHQYALLTAALSSPHDTLLTTRDYSLPPSQFSFDRHLLNQGFSDEQIRAYIKQYFTSLPEPDEKQSEHMIKLIRANDRLWSHAHNPLILTLACDFYRDNQESGQENLRQLPLAGLYHHSVKTFIRRYLDQQSKYLKKHQLAWERTQESSLEDLAAVCPVEVTFLQTLAFMGVQQGLQRFDRAIKQTALAEVRKHYPTGSSAPFLNALKMGMLNEFPGPQISSLAKVHEFVHLTFQEYLAARYLVTKLQLNQANAYSWLRANKYDPKYHEMLNFICTMMPARDYPQFWQVLLQEQTDITGLGHVRLLLYSLEAARCDIAIPGLNNHLKDIGQTLLGNVKAEKLKYKAYWLTQSLKRCPYVISQLNEAFWRDLEALLLSEKETVREQAKDLLKSIVTHGGQFSDKLRTRVLTTTLRLVAHSNNKIRAGASEGLVACAEQAAQFSSAERAQLWAALLKTKTAVDWVEVYTLRSGLEGFIAQAAHFAPAERSQLLAALLKMEVAGGKEWTVRYVVIGGLAACAKQAAQFSPAERTQLLAILLKLAECEDGSDQDNAVVGLSACAEHSLCFSMAERHQLLAVLFKTVGPGTRDYVEERITAYINKQLAQLPSAERIELLTTLLKAEVAGHKYIGSYSESVAVGGLRAYIAQAPLLSSTERTQLLVALLEAARNEKGVLLWSAFRKLAGCAEHVAHFSPVERDQLLAALAEAAENEERIVQEYAVKGLIACINQVSLLSHASRAQLVAVLVKKTEKWWNFDQSVRRVAAQGINACVEHAAQFSLKQRAQLLAALLETANSRDDEMREAIKAEAIKELIGYIQQNDRLRWTATDTLDQRVTAAERIQLVAALFEAVEESNRDIQKTVTHELTAYLEQVTHCSPAERMQLLTALLKTARSKDWDAHNFAVNGLTTYVEQAIHFSSIERAKLFAALLEAVIEDPERRYGIACCMTVYVKQAAHFSAAERSELLTALTKAATDKEEDIRDRAAEWMVGFTQQAAHFSPQERSKLLVALQKAIAEGNGQIQNKAAEWIIAFTKQAAHFSLVERSELLTVFMKMAAEEGEQMRRVAAKCLLACAEQAAHFSAAERTELLNALLKVVAEEQRPQDEMVAEEIGKNEQEAAVGEVADENEQAQDEVVDEIVNESEWIQESVAEGVIAFTDQATHFSTEERMALLATLMKAVAEGNERLQECAIKGIAALAMQTSQFLPTERFELLAALSKVVVGKNLQIQDRAAEGIANYVEQATQFHEAEREKLLTTLLKVMADAGKQVQANLVKSLTVLTNSSEQVLVIKKPQLLAVLLRATEDENSRIRYAASHALSVYVKSTAEFSVADSAQLLNAVFKTLADKGIQPVEDKKSTEYVTKQALAVGEYGQHLSTLWQAITHKNRCIKQIAARALESAASQIGRASPEERTRWLSALLQALVEDNWCEQRVTLAALEAATAQLGCFSSAERSKWLSALLPVEKEGDWYTREVTARALKSAVSQIEQFLPDERSRWLVILLQTAASDGNWCVRKEAVRALESVAAKIKAFLPEERNQWLAGLLRALGDKAVGVRRSAAEALAAVANQVELFLQAERSKWLNALMAFEDGASAARRALLEAFGTVINQIELFSAEERSRCVNALLQAVTSKSKDLRLTAITVIASIKVESLPELERSQLLSALLRASEDQMWDIKDIATQGIIAYVKQAKHFTSEDRAQLFPILLATAEKSYGEVRDAADEAMLVYVQQTARFSSAERAEVFAALTQALEAEDGEKDVAIKRITTYMEQVIRSSAAECIEVLSVASKAVKIDNQSLREFVVKELATYVKRIAGLPSKERAQLLNILLKVAEDDDDPRRDIAEQAATIYLEQLTRSSSIECAEMADTLSKAVKNNNRQVRASASKELITYAKQAARLSPTDHAQLIDILLNAGANGDWRVREDAEHGLIAYSEQLTQFSATQRDELLKALLKAEIGRGGGRQLKEIAKRGLVVYFQQAKGFSSAERSRLLATLISKATVAETEWPESEEIAALEGLAVYSEQTALFSPEERAQLLSFLLKTVESKKGQTARGLNFFIFEHSKIAAIGLTAYVKQATKFPVLECFRLLVGLLKAEGHNLDEPKRVAAVELIACAKQSARFSAEERRQLIIELMKGGNGASYAHEVRTAVAHILGNCLNALSAECYAVLEMLLSNDYLLPNLSIEQLLQTYFAESATLVSGTSAGFWQKLKNPSTQGVVRSRRELWLQFITRRAVQGGVGVVFREEECWLYDPSSAQSTVVVPFPAADRASLVRHLREAFTAQASTLSLPHKIAPSPLPLPAEIHSPTAAAFGNISDEVVEQLAERVERAEEKQVEHEEVLAVHAQRLTSLEMQVADIKKMFTQHEKALERHEAGLARHRQMIESFGIQMVELDKKLMTQAATMEAEIGRCKDDMVEATARCEHLLEGCLAQIGALEKPEQKTINQKEYQQLQAEQAQLRNSLQTLGERIKNLETADAHSIEELTKLQALAPTLQAMKVQYESQEKRLKERESLFQNEKLAEFYRVVHTRLTGFYLVCTIAATGLVKIESSPSLKEKIAKLLVGTLGDNIPVPGAKAAAQFINGMIEWHRKTREEQGRVRANVAAGHTALSFADKEIAIELAIQEIINRYSDQIKAVKLSAIATLATCVVNRIAHGIQELDVAKDAKGIAVAVVDDFPMQLANWLHRVTEFHQGTFGHKVIDVEPGVLPTNKAAKSGVVQKAKQHAKELLNREAWTEDGIFRLSGIRSKSTHPSEGDVYWYAELDPSCCDCRRYGFRYIKNPDIARREAELQRFTETSDIEPYGSWQFVPSLTIPSTPLGKASFFGQTAAAVSNVLVDQAPDLAQTAYVAQGDRVNKSVEKVVDVLGKQVAERMEGVATNVLNVKF